MKPNKSIPPANAAPPAKASTRLKAASTRANAPVTKVLPQQAPTPQGGTKPPPSHSADEVALRAYYNYQKRGSADGDPHGDWLQAEAELTAERLLMHA